MRALQIIDRDKTSPVLGGKSQFSLDLSACVLPMNTFSTSTPDKDQHLVRVNLLFFSDIVHSCEPSLSIDKESITTLVIADQLIVTRETRRAAV